MIKEIQAALATLYKYRDLILSLIGKELKGRYRGSVLGMLWTFLNPLLLLLVYALVFSVYMRVQVENYAVFVFAGLLPWIWFSSAVMEGVNAVVVSGDLITKSMFPAEILPLVKVASTFVNFLFSLPLIFVFMLIYGIPFGASLIWLPLLVITQLLFTLGFVYILSVVNVLFRDTQHILANFLTLWFFLCPIIYPATQVPAEWRFTFYLNPMAIMTLGYQDVLINGANPEFLPVLLTLLMGVFITFAGMVIFERYKETFAEQI